MTNSFLARLIHEGIVDTRVYRYVYRAGYDAQGHPCGVIRRIRLTALDTTDAIDGWETVRYLY